MRYDIIFDIVVVLLLCIYGVITHKPVLKPKIWPHRLTPNQWDGFAIGDVVDVVLFTGDSDKWFIANKFATIIGFERMHHKPCVWLKDQNGKDLGLLGINAITLSQRFNKQQEQGTIS